MKEYMKPTITEVDIMPNQAIASCAVTNTVKVTPIGYRCQWDGASMSDKIDVTNHLKEAHGYSGTTEASFIPYCWKVEEIGGDGSFRWEDLNSNGVYDAGDNKQDVHWWKDINNVMTS